MLLGNDKSKNGSGDAPVVALENGQAQVPVPQAEKPLTGTLQTEAVVNVPTGADPSSGLFRTLWIRNFSLEAASAFADKLFQLAVEDSETPILVMITSFGGNVHSCLALADAMDVCGAPIRTCVFGTAMSAGAFLAAHGAKGERYVFSHSNFMLHQLSTFIIGDAEDVKAEAEEAIRMNDVLIQMLAADTGKSEESIRKLLTEGPNENYFDAAGGVEFGLADKIVASLADILPVQSEEGEAA